MTTTHLDKNIIYGLYCLCCEPTQIRYVGQTSVGAGVRLAGHTSMIAYREKHGLRLSHSQRWMKKHGVENIALAVLEVCATPDELGAAEERWIGSFDGLTNIKPGGAQSRGWKMPPGTRAGGKNPMWGKRRSPEFMAKVRAARKPLSEENRAARAKLLEVLREDPEWDAKRIEGLRAAVRTPEHRERARQRVLGEKNPMYGRKMSEEERRKLSLSLTGLSEGDIVAIRSLVKDEGLPQKAVAERFNIDPSTVSRIANRKRFGWVE